MRSEPPSALLLVEPVVRLSTTSPHTMLIFTTRINLFNKLPPPPLVSVPPRRLLKRHLLRKPRKPRVLPQNKPQQLAQKTPLSARTGKPIQSLSPQISFPVAKRLLRRTVNTGPRSVRVLAAVTDYKTGIIFACPPSVLQASANNSAASLQIRLPSLK